VALADDSGLAVDALGGAPGVFTADWATTAQGRDFGVGMSRVWRELEAIKAPEPRRAQFCCTLVLATPDGQDLVFEGKSHGRLVWPGRGAQGHGFDPIFLPDGYSQTFGEMDRWKKNRLSHRADAFQKLVTSRSAPIVTSTVMSRHGLTRPAGWAPSKPRSTASVH
jgi:XTP/dITP diphosphohydrolase